MSSPRRLTGGLFGVGRVMFWRGTLTSLPALPTPAPAPAPPPPACAKAKVALPATKAAAIRVVTVFIGDLLRRVGCLNNPFGKPIVPKPRTGCGRHAAAPAPGVFCHAFASVRVVDCGSGAGI